jgi:hypothetical protein
MVGEGASKQDELKDVLGAEAEEGAKRGGTS